MVEQSRLENTNPVNSVWFALTLGALSGLLMFASPVATGAVFSIREIVQHTASTAPLALELFFAGNRFKPGRLSLLRLAEKRRPRKLWLWNLGR